MIKKFIILLTVCYSFISCQPDNPTDPSPTNCSEPAAFFRYKLNGTLIEMNGSLSKNSMEGSYIRRVKDYVLGTTCSPYYTSGCNNYIYALEATKWNLLDDEGNPCIKITLRAPSLSTGQTLTGRTGIWVVCYYPSNMGNIYGASDQYTTNFSLTITKVENGYVDGTFSGELKNSAGTTTYQVTEGAFSNVKLLQ